MLHAELSIDRRQKMIVEMSKGRQITLPVDIREEFNLAAGSKLELIKRHNEIILKPLGNELEELFKEADKIKPKHKLTAKQMDELNERLFR